MVKELGTYIHLLYSGNTLYIKPDARIVTLHCGLEIATPLDQRFIH